MSQYPSSMISQTAEYALRAVVFLADHEGEPYTSEQISAATKVPVGYLSKILQILARSGLINSQRGPLGGFSLAQPKGKVTVYDVVQVIDPIRRIESCPLELKTHAKLCNLHRLLDSAAAQVERSFKKATMASLLSDKGSPSKPLCEFPRHPVDDLEPVRREGGGRD